MKSRVGQTWVTIGLGDEVIFVVVRTTLLQTKERAEHQALVLQGGSIKLGKTADVLPAGKLHTFGESWGWDDSGVLERIA